MSSRRLEKLADLYGRDLAGWQITQVHFLELEHGLMGNLPAIRRKDRKVVVVLDKSSLKKVWDRLERRQAKVVSVLAVANPTLGVAFSLQCYAEGETKPLRLFTSSELGALSREKEPFQWAPGLLDLSSNTRVPDPAFT